MLALIAALDLAVSFGTSGATISGAAVGASEVLSLRAGWSFDDYELYVRGEAAALNRDCHGYLYDFSNCVSSKLLTGGLRRLIDGTLGVALELGAGTATGSVSTAFDRGVSVSGTSLVPGAVVDVRLPIGHRSDVRFGVGSSLWLLSPIILAYRAEIGVGASF